MQNVRVESLLNNVSTNRALKNLKSLKTLKSIAKLMEKVLTILLHSIQKRLTFNLILETYEKYVTEEMEEARF